MVLMGTEKFLYVSMIVLKQSLFTKLECNRLFTWVFETLKTTEQQNCSTES